jgi:hypothetical protein
MKNVFQVSVAVLEDSIELIVSQQNLINEFPVEIDGKAHAARTVKFVRMEASLNVDSGFYEGKALFAPGKYPEPALAGDYKDLLELLNIHPVQG